MNIHEAIEALIALAQRLPDGPNTKVVVHVCGGPEGQAVWTSELDIVEEQLFTSTMELKETTAVVSVHPHLDPNMRRARPLDVDDELGKILDDESPPDPDTA